MFLLYNTLPESVKGFLKIFLIFLKIPSIFSKKEKNRSFFLTVFHNIPFLLLSSIFKELLWQSTKKRADFSALLVLFHYSAASNEISATIQRILTFHDRLFPIAHVVVRNGHA